MIRVQDKVGLAMAIACYFLSLFGPFDLHGAKVIHSTEQVKERFNSSPEVSNAGEIGKVGALGRSIDRATHDG